MTHEIDSAVAELAVDLEASRTWWHGSPRISVVDVGYPEVSTLVAPPYVALNLPTDARRDNDSSPFGMPLATGSDGVTEVVSASAQGLEILCVSASGRLLETSEPEVSNRVASTADVARKAALNGDADRFAWAACRLDHLSGEPWRGRGGARRPFLVGSAKAAAIAGLPIEEWNLHFAAAYSNTTDVRNYLHSLLSSRDAGLTLTPEAVLVLAARVGQVHTAASLAVACRLSASQIENALTELCSLGLAMWPAPLSTVAETIGISKLRAVLGPHGIKGQSTAILVERALSALGDQRMAELVESLGADLSQVVFTPSGEKLRLLSYSEIDHRATRLGDMLYSDRALHVPSGLPPGFGQENDVDVRAGEEPGLVDSDVLAMPSDDGRSGDDPADETLEELAAHMAEAVDLARLHLLGPDSQVEAIELVRHGLAGLLDVLAEAAERAR